LFIFRCLKCCAVNFDLNVCLRETTVGWELLRFRGDYFLSLWEYLVCFFQLLGSKVGLGIIKTPSVPPAPVTLYQWKNHSSGLFSKSFVRKTLVAKRQKIVIIPPALNCNLAAVITPPVFTHIGETQPLHGATLSCHSVPPSLYRLSH
jgi:hypothetical protein